MVKSETLGILQWISISSHAQYCRWRVDIRRLVEVEKNRKKEKTHKIHTHTHTTYRACWIVFSKCFPQQRFKCRTKEHIHFRLNSGFNLKPRQRYNLQQNIYIHTSKRTVSAISMDEICPIHQVHFSIYPKNQIHILQNTFCNIYK